MPERVFYVWQVRSFTVRLALDFVETLAGVLKDQRISSAQEYGGLLFGRVIDNDTVEVTGFEFIRSKHHSGASYDLGGGERYSVERHVRSFGGKSSGPRPVGYFRTHLRPGLFLDQSDFALMTESFSDIPGVALAIRIDGSDPSNAGIFFWEDGDIDRSRAELMFPFDAAALRVQGPVEEEIQALTIADNARAWAWELKTSSASSLLWATAAAIVVFAMAAEFRQGNGQARRIDNVSVPSAAPTRAPFPGPKPAPVHPEMRAVSNTAPAAFPDAPPISFEGADQTNSFSPAVRFPFDISGSQTVSPPIREADDASIGSDAQRSEQAGADAQTIAVQPQTTRALPGPHTQKSELRMELLRQLNGVVSMRDTSRGLVATVPDSAFDGSELHAAASVQLARLAAAIQAHPGLRTVVEGNADTSAGEETSLRRAEAVRVALIAEGLPDSGVTARGLGDTRLFGPNSTAAGREANRRVEIVISGDPIGDLPLWDHTHAITPER